jgi:hypothetical protein
MKKFYATFGYNLFPNSHNLYVEIHAEDYAEARKKMFERYGQKWAFLYEESQKKEAIDRWGLQLYEVMI